MSSKKYSRDWLTSEARRLVFRVFMNHWTPPPRQTVSEWADTNRRLSSESSAETGNWDTSRAEYQRGMMDAVSDINVTDVTFMTSSQIGKTEIMNNVVGFFIDRDPAPIMFLQPTLDMADAWSEDRLSPMLRDTPCLQNRVNDTKSRSSENKKRHKIFSGGHITVAGANSAASLASRPIRVLLCDEIDRYPFSAGVEGDPIELAEKRTTTFWNRKKVKASTPTLKGVSRIAKEFEESDKRHFHVPCPHCGEYQVLRWKNVKWENDDPDTAMYCCEECGCMWNDVERWNAVGKGHWVATSEFKGHAGFWIWEAYSPWVKLSEMVSSFLKAKRKGPESLKVFVNTSLAECWEDKGERVSDEALMARREDYGDIAPAEVVVVTAGVDIQGDRIEVDRYGWSADEQSWGLGKIVIHGDPTGQEIWQQLDDVLREPVRHALVGEMPIMATGIDSGYLTQQVGLFCRPRWGRRIWALKGIAGAGRPIWEQSPNKLKKLNLKFFRVGADQAKETIYSRLKIDEPDSPGYCHFSMSYDETHFEQLTSEEVVTSYKRGRPMRYWRLKEGKKRNEALDIFVYAMAALEGLRLMGLSLRRRRKELLSRAGVTADEPKREMKNQSVEDPKPEQPEAQKTSSPLVMKKRKKRRVIRMM